MTKNLKGKLCRNYRLRVQIQTQRACGTPLGTKAHAPSESILGASMKAFATANTTEPSLLAVEN